MGRSILILAILGPALYLLLNLVYLVVAIAAGQNLHDVNQVFDVLNRVTIYLLLGSAGLAYLLSVVDTARRQRWGWFVLVLLPPLLVAGAVYLFNPAGSSGGGME
jgi:cell division protein FtsW (lipid II flippase)